MMKITFGIPVPDSDSPSTRLLKEFCVGLTPHHIMRFIPQDFSDIKGIYVKRNLQQIMHRQRQNSNKCKLNIQRHIPGRGFGILI